MLSTEQEIRNFAIWAHGDQTYGGDSNIPYIDHLDEVVRLIKQYSFLLSPSEVEEAIIVGYLHDVLEDAPVTYEELKELVGGNIARMVWALTNQTSKDRTFKEIASYSITVFVKLCDRLANVSNGKIFNKYFKEHHIFGSYFRQHTQFSIIFHEIDMKLANASNRKNINN